MGMDLGKGLHKEAMTREEYMRRYYDGDEKRAIIQHRVSSWSHTSTKGKS